MKIRWRQVILLSFNIHNCLAIVIITITIVITTANIITALIFTIMIIL